MAKKITGWFIIVVTAVIICYDIVIAIFGGPGGTISEVFLRFAWQHPFVPFTWGVLAGHLTWPSKAAHQNRLWRIIGLGLVGAVALAVDVFAPLPEVLPILPVCVGVVAGHLLWPQADMGGSNE